MDVSVKGLIFDYGGTIDTNGVHWGEVIWREYEKAGVPVSREIYRNAYVSVERKLGAEQLILPHNTFRETLDIKLRMQFEELRLSDMIQAEMIAGHCYENTILTVNRAKETLNILKTRYPMILVSNFYGNLNTVLREFGLNEYFNDVIESAGIGIRKPDPEIYRMAIYKMGLTTGDVVIIGDSYKNDIDPANILGCRSVWLKKQSWDDRDKAIDHPSMISDLAELVFFHFPA